MALKVNGGHVNKTLELHLGVIIEMGKQGKQVAGSENPQPWGFNPDSHAYNNISYVPDIHQEVVSLEGTGKEVV